MSAATTHQAMPAGEFNCSECGRHIIVIAGPVSEFHLCAACIVIPGWHADPAFRAAIDAMGASPRTAS